MWTFTYFGRDTSLRKGSLELLLLQKDGFVAPQWGGWF